MTKAKVYTYPIPGDLEFVGRPRWDKITVKDALRDLRNIEKGMTLDLEEFPGHPQEHLVIAVLNRARASRRRLEEDEGALRDVIADIQHLEKLIKEIKWRDGEPDRQRGVRWRSTGRKPSALTMAIDAALKDLDAPGAKASTREIFNHIAINTTDVLNPAHAGGLSQIMVPPRSITLDDGDEITWINFQKRISARRKKMRTG